MDDNSTNELQNTFRGININFNDFSFPDDNEIKEITKNFI